MKNKKLFLALISSLLLCSCTVSNNNKYSSYLNYKYNLVSVGDIKGADIYQNYRLSQYKDYVSYIEYFNTTSYINFQCEGDSFDTFHCNSEIHVSSIDESIYKIDESFLSSYSGSNYGEVYVLEDSKINIIPKIYVYTLSWVRYQAFVDINKDNNPILLTFEFIKGEYNPLPGFISDK